MIIRFYAETIYSTAAAAAVAAVCSGNMVYNPVYPCPTLFHLCPSSGLAFKVYLYSIANLIRTLDIPPQKDGLYIREFGHIGKHFLSPLAGHGLLKLLPGTERQYRRDGEVGFAAVRAGLVLDDGPRLEALGTPFLVHERHVC